MALVSTHLPVSKVAEAVTKESVDAAIDSLNLSLRQDFGFERPKIAVLSLNPHAGDGGVLGTEEKEIIEPAIAEFRERECLRSARLPPTDSSGLAITASLTA